MAKRGVTFSYFLSSPLRKMSNYDTVEFGCNIFIMSQNILNGIISVLGEKEEFYYSVIIKGHKFKYYIKKEMQDFIYILCYILAHNYENHLYIGNSQLLFDT